MCGTTAAARHGGGCRWCVKLRRWAAHAQGWHDAVGPKVKPLFERYVELMNAAAVEHNFTDAGELWRYGRARRRRRRRSHARSRHRCRYRLMVGPLTFAGTTR